MKIVIASDSYKGSCTSLEVANAIENGFLRIYPGSNIVKIPIADGGEGTVDALVSWANGSYERVEVLDPLGETIEAQYGIINGDTAIIEMAAASGLTLLHRDRRNPMVTTTYGTGQLIKAAMEKGIRKIYVGLGGSATNDCGLGMAQALGYSFKDAQDTEVGFGGGELGKVVEVDDSNVHPLLKETEIIILSDVNNPLYGESGAAYVFGPQKGADSNMVKELDDNLRYFSGIIKEYLEEDISEIPGTGAAGGLGFGMMAFCKGKALSGIEEILNIVNIDKHLKDADFVFTGEGRIDGQTKHGKVPLGIAKRAAKYKVPVIAIVGSIGEGYEENYDLGIDLILDIVNRPMSFDKAYKYAKVLIEDQAENAGRILKFLEKMKER